MWPEVRKVRPGGWGPGGRVRGCALAIMTAAAVALMSGCGAAQTPAGATPESGSAVTLAVTLPPGTRHLLNPGSVGQPRDRDWRAAFAIFNSEPTPGEGSTITFHRVPYDLVASQGRILMAGLPDRLAARLREGR